MKTVCQKHQQAYEVTQGCPYCPSLAQAKARTVLTPAVLSDHFAAFEARNVRVTCVWLNVMDFADLRKYGSGLFEAETDYDMLRMGLRGFIWSASIWISQNIPEGQGVFIGLDDDSTDMDKDTIPGPSSLTAL